MPNITVKNETGEEIFCKVYPAGFEEYSQQYLMLSDLEYRFYFNISAETYLILVEGRAVRAISKNKIACLRNLSNGLLIITVEDFSLNVCFSSKEIIEDHEVNKNWNAVLDESVNNDMNEKAIADIQKMIELNKQITAVFGMIAEATVTKFSGSKYIAKLVSKASTEFFNSYLKVSIPLLKETEDPALIFKLNDIRQTLVSISRHISYGYPYFRESINTNDSNQIVNYLHGLLLKITTENIFPFLEECCLPIAVPIYILGISIVRDLLSMVREITNVEISETETSFINVFINNLKVMWDGILDNVKNSIIIKTKGCIVKKVSIWYKGQLIYYIKSISKKRAIKKIEEVKQAFIMNRKWQMEFMYDHPSDFVRNFNEQLHLRD